MDYVCTYYDSKNGSIIERNGNFTLRKIIFYLWSVMKCKKSKCFRAFDAHSLSFLIMIFIMLITFGSMISNKVNVPHHGLLFVKWLFPCKTSSMTSDGNKSTFLCVHKNEKLKKSKECLSTIPSHLKHLFFLPLELFLAMIKYLT